MKELSTLARATRLAHLIILMLLMSPFAWADESVPDNIVGRLVADIIDEYRADGHPFAYSTMLVTDELRVEARPTAGSAVEVVAQILRPHGLTIRTEAGVHLVVPVESPRPVDAASQSDPETSRLDELENVVVSASRYLISRDIETSRMSIDQRSIQNMPDFGEDPIRVVQRLPGTAASGASARTHFRGGEQSEVGIMLNGQWLFDPYHIRDYQGVFSAIDARAVGGVEVFTGGFPVRYGDRMSGLVLLDSIEADRTPQNEIGLSVFNTSLLTAGSTDKQRWLFSVRRGNLDLVIDPKFGKPSYFDMFAQYGFDFSPDSRISVNALYAEDAIELILETEPSERDMVSSDTRNGQFWVRIDNDWSDALSSSTVLSFTDYTNRREGFANDDEKMIATVLDYREVSQVAYRQNWYWNGSKNRRTEWGLYASSASARFDYAGTAEYFGLQARYRGQPPSISRDIKADIGGSRYALYFSDRLRFADRMTLEWGLRWDDQTYTGESGSTQLSPRLSALFQLAHDTEFRFSVGRYFQSQPIEALQVEDGVANYWPAQRADQLVLGLQHRFDDDSILRVEAFYKDFGRVRPRFENLYDPLGTMPELQADRIRIAPRRSLARGVELSLYKGSDNQTLWGSYAWSRATDRIDGTNIPRSWDQTHAVQIGFEWRGGKWTVSTAASAHTGWPTTSLSLTDAGVAVPGPRNDLRYDWFAAVDARVSRRFDLKRGSLLAFIEISNLFDRRNECCIDWDIEQTTVGSEYLDSSQEYWMPLLPAFGVLWEF